MKVRSRSGGVEALQYNGRNIQDVMRWSGVGVCESLGRGLEIPTANGKVVLLPGDWIIRDDDGAVTAIKPDMFAALYEAVKE